MKGGDDVAIIRRGWDGHIDQEGSEWPVLLLQNCCQGWDDDSAASACHRDKNFQCHQYLHVRAKIRQLMRKLVPFDTRR